MYRITGLCTAVYVVEAYFKPWASQGNKLCPDSLEKKTKSRIPISVEIITMIFTFIFLGNFH